VALAAGCNSTTAAALPEPTEPGATIDAEGGAAIDTIETEGGALTDAKGGAAIDAEAGAAIDAEAGPTCALDTSYTFGNNGGLVAFQDESTLSPPGSYERARRVPEADGSQVTASCAPALPACNDDTRIDIGDILRDIANADVQTALAATSPPIYGLDTRPGDGSIFGFSRADGRGFFAGAECDGGSFCHGLVPAGVSQLEADLKSLDLQELADPACAAFP
jgi:hypothetical protein